MNFIHLHTHSHYSLLDGLPKIPELVQHAKKLNMPALALTDHGVMYGLIEFYQQCKASNIKPILGMEAYLAPNGLHSKRPKIDEKPYHLILLAKNNTGYQNLLKLTSIAHLEGFYYKPRIDLEILKKYNDGLMALTACLQGEVAKTAANYSMEKTEEVIKKYLTIFSAKDFYLEIQHHPNLPEQQKVNNTLIPLSKKLNCKLVATNDIHYLKPEDAEAQDILVCIQTKKQLTDKNRLSMMDEDYSFKSTTEMSTAFKETPEAITNTLEIADKCHVELELGKIQLPYYDLPEDTTPDKELKKICEKGLQKRFASNISQEIIERLNFELSVIAKTGFASYFLIVQDFVNWAKNNKIVVGPGRGSAAGSIVAYLSNVTNIDPIKYDLLFERFLNPERISMPDIDMDFADARRDEVLHYVENKYGKNHVAQIITFGTMAARAAVRDVGRVMGLSYNYCDKVAKMIPMFTDLKTALNIVPELKEIYQNDPDAVRLLESAQKLEGVARHSSTHACGVVITYQPLNHYTPLQYASQDDKVIITQYSLHPIEDLGLLKMDFLGLKNLTIIEDTINIIQATTHEEINIDNIPLDDKKTFKLLQRAKTTGVFQLESAGMKRYLKELKPTEFEDIIAMVALYRPGPMEWIPDYIAGKQGERQPQYLHQNLKNILDKTYGVAIYQEQLMQIARDLAGFTLGEADVLRKAIAKKIPKLLAEQKNKFINGCIKNNITENIAKKIFDFIEPFAGYGFNRSHAACYALIAYQTAYLKANWPTQFMAALLTSDYGDTDRIAIEVEEAKQLKMQVLAPDINESYATFTVVNDNLIRFGLTAIKNLGNHIVDILIKERKKNGLFKNLSDFLLRIHDKDLNKKSLESLIKSGALDKFGDRQQMLDNIENLLNISHQAQQERNSGQINIFKKLPVNHTPGLTLTNSKPTTNLQKLTWEKELMGLYISSHPLADYHEKIKRHYTSIDTINKHLNKYVKIVGVVMSYKKIFTRKNEPMVFMQTEDETAKIETIIFPKIYQEYSTLIQENNILVVEGKISNKEGSFKMIADKISIFQADDLPDYKAIVVTVPHKIKKEIFTQLKSMVKKYHGDLSLFLQVNNKKIDTKIKVNIDIIDELKNLFGENSISLL